jgi:hypothetical protein
MGSGGTNYVYFSNQIPVKLFLMNNLGQNDRAVGFCSIDAPLRGFYRIFVLTAAPLFRGKVCPGKIFQSLSIEAPKKLKIFFLFFCHSPFQSLPLHPIANPCIGQ